MGENREGELQVQSRRLLEFSLVDPSQMSGTIPSHESTSPPSNSTQKGIIISPRHRVWEYSIALYFKQIVYKVFKYHDRLHLEASMVAIYRTQYISLS